VNVTFSVRLPADADSVTFVRNLVRTALVQLRIETAVIDDVALALTEACANVVEHAPIDNEYDVEVDLRPDECVFVVRDRGPGFDVASTEAVPTSSIVAGGRGIFLMRSLVDDLDFRPGPTGGHELLLRKRLVSA
jgi:serine/threonine-protein kinase RsbW